MMIIKILSFKKYEYIFIFFQWYVISIKNKVKYMSTDCFTTLPSDINDLKRLATQGNQQAKFDLETYHTTKMYQNNNQNTQYELGMHYKEIHLDNKKAFFWFQQAAQQGHYPAKYELGKIYLSCKNETANNKAIDYLEEVSTDGGIEEAQYELALAYLYYNKRHKEEAKYNPFPMLKAIADKENEEGIKYHGDAQYQVAKTLQKNENISEALYYFELACKNNIDKAFGKYFDLMTKEK